MWFCQSLGFAMAGTLLYYQTAKITAGLHPAWDQDWMILGESAMLFSLNLLLANLISWRILDVIERESS